jgi:hypothetical protein
VVRKRGLRRAGRPRCALPAPPPSLPRRREPQPNPQTHHPAEPGAAAMAWQLRRHAGGASAAPAAHGQARRRGVRTGGGQQRRTAAARARARAAAGAPRATQPAWGRCSGPGRNGAPPVASLQPRRPALPRAPAFRSPETATAHGAGAAQRESKARTQRLQRRGALSRPPAGLPPARVPTRSPPSSGARATRRLTSRDVSDGQSSKQRYLPHPPDTHRQPSPGLGPLATTMLLQGRTPASTALRGRKGVLSGARVVPTPLRRCAQGPPRKQPDRRRRCRAAARRVAAPPPCPIPAPARHRRPRGPPAARRCAGGRPRRARRAARRRHRGPARQRARLAARRAQTLADRRP